MKKVAFNLLVVWGVCFVLIGHCFAENNEAMNNKRRIAVLVLETLSEEEISEIMVLKVEDREKFKEVLGIKLRQRKEELLRMRDENPLEFKEVLIEAQSSLQKKRRRSRKNKHFQKNMAECKAQLTKMPQRKNNGKLQKGLIFETLSKSQQKKIVALREKYQKYLSKAIKAKYDELAKLREDNPQEYTEVIQSAKDELGQRVVKGKKRYPGKFNKLKKLKPEYLKEKLRWLKEENPDAYQELIGTLENEEEK